MKTAYLAPLVLLAAVTASSACEITITLRSACANSIWVDSALVLSTDEHTASITVGAAPNTESTVVLKSFCAWTWTGEAPYLAGTVAVSEGKTYLTDGTWECVDHYPLEDSTWMTGGVTGIPSATVVGETSHEAINGLFPAYIGVSVAAVESICRKKISTSPVVAEPPNADQTAPVPSPATVDAPLQTSAPPSPASPPQEPASPETTPAPSPETTPAPFQTDNTTPAPSPASPQEAATPAPSPVSSPVVDYEVTVHFNASSAFNRTTLTDRLRSDNGAVAVEVITTDHREVLNGTRRRNLQTVDGRCGQVTGVVVLHTQNTTSQAAVQRVVKEETAPCCNEERPPEVCSPAPRLVCCNEEVTGPEFVHVLRTKGSSRVSAQGAGVRQYSSCCRSQEVEFGVEDVYVYIPRNVTACFDCC